MGSDYVPLICYYEGELQPGTSDPIYVGGHIKTERVRKNITFTEFVSKIHELCKSPTEEANIDIKCRYLLDERKSIAIHVVDDNSLGIIMDLHPHQCNAIAVYIEKQSAQNSSTTYTRHEKGSSLSGSGDWNHEEKAQVATSVDQSTRYDFRKIESVVVGRHSNMEKNKEISSPFKDSISLPRYLLDPQKEVEMSSRSTSQEVWPKEYKPTSPTSDDHLEPSDSHRHVSDILNDLNTTTPKSTKDSSLSRSHRQGADLSWKPSRKGIASTNKLSHGWFRRGILDPKDSYLQRWNKIFVFSSMLALALDALFFYTPAIDAKKSCLNWDKNLEIWTCVLRSLTDIIHVIHIVFQFRTGFLIPSSEVFGTSEFVKDLRAIASRYFSSSFVIDILAILPLPQVLVLIAMPAMSGSIDVKKKNVLRYIVLLQYIPRFLRIYPLYKELRRVNRITKTAWTGAALNFSLFMLASHIFGAFWYFLSVERQTVCWRGACGSTASCNPYSLSCRDQTAGGNEFLRISCPVTEPNKTMFDFGIYLDALQSGIPEKGFLEKLVYCFWWGLQNMGCFGQNLKTSSYVWEVCFAVSVSVFGLFLFLRLIGNMQTYLQSESLKSEKEFAKKLQDAEQWMSRKFLPEDLRERIRQYTLFKWQTNKGFDEEILLRELPSDIKRDTKRHLCYALLLGVPIYAEIGREFLDALCDRLKPVLYTEGNFVMRKGYPVDEMVFIMSGELSSATGIDGYIENISYLKAGDFVGEELIGWSFTDANHSKPISKRTVWALKEVEAFALLADDLKLVHSQFRHQWKFLTPVYRYFSPEWRTWAVCYIQAAWRRHCRRRLMRRLGDRRLHDQIAQSGERQTTLVSAIYVSKFATAALRTIQRIRSKQRGYMELP